MTDLDQRKDNTLGNPIFEPELTGAKLVGDTFADWINFCTAVVTNEEAIYNTWFENRYYRAEHDRASSVVHAFEHNGMICIRCPSKVWAQYLRENMSKLRGYSGRAFWVLAPNEDPPKPTDPDQLCADIAEWERLGSEPRNKNLPFGPEHYRRLAALARKELERYEKRRAA